MTDEEVLRLMRKQILLMVERAGSGHIASAYSCLEIIYALYGKGILRKDYDHFILSKGHGSLAWYVNLQRAGYFPKEELYTFAMPKSRLGGEPRYLELPGVDAATGSLGHGLSLGIGRALAHKLDGEDAKTYVLLGDGECQEGSIWEAVMSARKLHLDHLIAVLDCNGIQKMARVDEIMEINEWRTKFKCFGWDVREVDGHNLRELAECLSDCRQYGHPHLVIAHTVKGKGVSIMENNPGWHWRKPSGKREWKICMEELGISQEEIDNARSLCGKYVSNS